LFRFTKKPSSGSHSQYLAKIKAWFSVDDGFFVNPNMLEQPP
jgi:hypothetical protein